ncbi:thiamine phosphate synthase [Brevundimonas sp. PAMC22021]|uniref:thiamine phosphate synthase n=1 Tax=Brevundimonas sp. PAMC22021 TaxID=2861285 RepID=UPI001C632915|nr:thiamine phosphate synthase [Brevundimonas sp. PAMC22021]QYF86733.1 thiamine phosphate synthase [Brevundimonas sp. PAMC22021]
MILPEDYSDEARALWNAALDLNRAAIAVSPGAGRLPPLLFFTDPDRTPRPWETAARLPRGAGVVFRAFGRAEALEIGQRLRAATAGRGVRLLVGRDADLAVRLEADGVHLPERAMAEATAMRRIRPDWLLTSAWHGAPLQIGAVDVDALVLSPVFPAGGASARKPALGVSAFRARTLAAPCPVYALGGVNGARAAGLAESGACGIAGVEAIQAAFAQPART